MIKTVSVKDIADFVHRRGDLFPPLDGRTRAEEGIETQRQVQRRRAESYQRERSVRREFVAGDFTLVINGRVDGFDEHSWLVEEIKTTRADAFAAERFLGSSHWAQLKMYAALLAWEYPEQQEWLLQLNYCHPDDHSERPLQQRLPRADLISFLDQTVAVFLAWQFSQQAYQNQRNTGLNQLVFPFQNYRVHQRALARRVFQSFRNREALLLEAPTGSGKTLGVLFPALKALASGHSSRLFYLTARSTGARAVSAALDLLDQQKPRLRSIELIAREHACATPGTPCRSDLCEYARGYYDRRSDAVLELLDRGRMDRATVAEVAAVYTVCPFELSLDAALWADLVVGDYNYIFDPVVRLQRFMGERDMGLLIDECHQLVDRTRDMLSLELHRHEVTAALREALPGALNKRLRSLDAALLKLRREQDLTTESVIPVPQALLRSISRFMTSLGEQDIDLEAFPATRELVFTLSRWQRADAWRDEDHFCFLGASPNASRGGRRNMTVRLACLDPAPYLHGVLDEFGPHVRFSGTLTPLTLYQRLHGLPEAPAERVASGFSPDQLALYIVNDISVLYRDRERSMAKLAQTLAASVFAQPGNYLIALPSFAYLDALYDTLSNDFPELALLRQERSLTAEQRQAFLDRFTEDSQHIGMVVLGGVFAESVDFPGGLLKGVFCVGVGLPPAEAIREAVAQYYHGVPELDGETVAYQLPAMQKILQMAGRLLRSPDDRGTVVLIDSRFQQQRFQQFFPAHWQPLPVTAAQLIPELENFWQAEQALPRLAAP